MKNNDNNDKLKKDRHFPDPGAVEDIYELKYRDEEQKSAPIAASENQINTAGATSSEPRIRG